MNLNIFSKILFVLIALKLKCALSEFNFTKYYQLPPLTQMDEYVRCLKGTEMEANYCLVISEILPNNKLPLWQNIKTFADKRKNFLHEIVINGLCLSRCEHIETLNETEKEQLYGGDFQNYDINKLLKNLYSSQDEKRKKFNKLANQCLNYDFQKKYNLTLRSNIEYCVSNRDEPKYDSVDLIFVAIVGIVLLLTVFSSFYDFRMKLKLTDPEQKLHYRKPVKGGQQWLLIFSICRNYYRLCYPAENPTHFARDLRFLEAFRVFMMYGVLMNHTLLGLNVIGLANPEYLEGVYHTIIKCILANGTLIMQTFFAMSGFLLAVIFTNEMKDKKAKDIKYTSTLIKFIILRYIRLTPVYALAILFGASLFTKLGDGPFWIHGSESEKIYCRQNWWTNLLYINNYVLTDQQCMPHAWYLAVDFQLFIFSIVLMLLITKHPRAKYFLYAISYLISIAIFVVILKVYDFKGIYYPTPEIMRYGIIMEDYFHKLFIPGHTNIGGYLSGIVFGLIYVDLKNRGLKIANSKLFLISFYGVVPVGMIIILSAEWFYIAETSTQSVWVALYLGITKNFYGIISAHFILGMSFKFGWIGYEFSSLPLFRVLGRLTYCAFIVHVFWIRAPSLEYYQPFHFGMTLTLTQIIGKFALTYLTAFMVSLIFELPISALIKLIISGGGAGRHKDQTTIKPITVTNGITIEKLEDKSEIYVQTQ